MQRCQSLFPQWHDCSFVSWLVLKEPINTLDRTRGKRRRENLREAIVSVVIISRSLKYWWPRTILLVPSNMPSEPLQYVKEKQQGYFESLCSHHFLSRPPAALTDLWWDHRSRLAWHSDYMALTFWYVNTVKPAGAVQGLMMKLKNLYAHIGLHMYVVSFPAVTFHLTFYKACFSLSVPLPPWHWCKCLTNTNKVRKGQKWKTIALKKEWLQIEDNGEYFIQK